MISKQDLMLLIKENEEVLKDAKKAMKFHRDKFLEEETKVIAYLLKQEKLQIQLQYLYSQENDLETVDTDKLDEEFRSRLPELLEKVK